MGDPNIGGLHSGQNEREFTRNKVKLHQRYERWRTGIRV